ncbi:actinia tenebrosa protease inhibitors [Hypanus sabinus]|uniref:actinia tenebrosa protease inhibitors n=1 Tax=Hypanus sabinus TaxID=79690 RepID=UPI0028C376F8|nr:actinia tenebrosa protease inhibitors [Hypanus sabinus]
MFQMKLQSSEMRRIILFLGVYIAAFNLRVQAQENNEICNEQKDPGHSENPSLRNIEWYYNNNTCDPFFYSGEGGNRNRFPNETACLKSCSSKYNKLFPDGSAACQLPKVRGDCQARILRWYYDAEADNCDTFFFSGCHGNGNNFENRKSCWNLCVTKKQGRRGAEAEIEVQTRDEGDTVAIVFGCLFGIAVIGFIVAFVIQRKKYKRHAKKSRCTEVEMK